MSNTSKVKSSGLLDLKKVKNIIFNDIETLLDSFDLDYRHDGDNIFMACPVHAGSDNPHGMSINTKYHSWRCWTHGCHEEYKSDIFGLINGMLGGVSFSEVLKYIRKHYDVSGAGKESDEPKFVEPEFNKIVKQFLPNDWETEEFDFTMPPTLSRSPYFESRGFQPQTLTHFGVRDCCDNKHPMRHRAIIPVHFRKQHIGFIARSTEPWLQPKYLFSPGLKKTHLLYNYDNAIERALETSCLFLVEGQGDVWKLWEAGCVNAVGLFGKSISLQQRQILLTSGLTRLIVLTDNDQPGREGKMKLKRDFGRFFDLVFPKMHTKDLGSNLVEQVQNNILADLKGCY